MKRFVFTVLVLLLAGATVIYAKDVEVYKRKSIKPNFFMPETTAPKKEVLPAFPALEKGLIKVTDDGVVLKKVFIAKKNVKQGSAPKKISRNVAANSEDMAKYLPSDGLGDDLSKDANYVAKIKSYEDDMQTFAKTKIMPRNQQLVDDLNKMNSEISFIVK